MICPKCRRESSIAYSALSNGLICLTRECGFELEMIPSEACQVLEPQEELVCT
jgi:hypothetical protein